MTTLKNGRASPADAALNPKDAISNVKSPGVGTGTAQPGLTQDDEAARHHRDAERNGGGESANASTSMPPREEEDELPSAPSQEAIDAFVAHGWTHDQALRALSNPVRVTPPSNPAPDESKVGPTPDEDDVPIGTPEEAEHHPDLVDEASAQKGGAIHESTPTTGRGVGSALDRMSDGIEGRGAGTLQESTPTTGRGAGTALEGEGLGDGLQQPVTPPPTFAEAGRGSRSGHDAADGHQAGRGGCRGRGTGRAGRAAHDTRSR